MPNKANEVDQAFSNDFSDFDFSERFEASENTTDAAERVPDPEEAPPADEGVAEERPDASPAETEASGDASGADEGAARSATNADSQQGPSAATKDARPATGGADTEVALEPNQTINQEGIIRERPTFYLRPDQMKAVRVAKAMRESPFGRDLSEIAMALFDLHGFGFEADRTKNDNYGYDAGDVLGRLVPEDQWEELLDAARAEEGHRAPRNALMYRVSRLIEDALHEAGYGDGRRRRKK